MGGGLDRFLRTHGLYEQIETFSSYGKMENSNSNNKKRNAPRNEAKLTNHTKSNQPTELTATQKHMRQNSFWNVLFKITGDFEALSGLDW